jgi:hypothetical protein
MKVFTVHEQPDPPADRVDRAERLRFVRDEFNWTALVWAPFVLLGAGLYRELLVYVAALVGIVLVMALLDADPAWIMIAVAALHVMIAYEIGEFQRRKLAAAGWTTVATVSGQSKSECERRFFDRWLPQQPMVRIGPASDAGGPHEPPPRGLEDQAARMGGRTGGQLLRWLRDRRPAAGGGPAS